MNNRALYEPVLEMEVGTSYFGEGLLFKYLECTEDSVVTTTANGGIARSGSNTGIRGISYIESRAKFRCKIPRKESVTGKPEVKEFTIGQKRMRLLWKISNNGPGTHEYEEALNKAIKWMEMKRAKKQKAESTLYTPTTTTITPTTTTITTTTQMKPKMKRAEKEKGTPQNAINSSKRKRSPEGTTPDVQQPDNGTPQNAINSSKRKRSPEGTTPEVQQPDNDLRTFRGGFRNSFRGGFRNPFRGKRKCHKRHKRITVGMNTPTTTTITPTTTTITTTTPKPKPTVNVLYRH